MTDQILQGSGQVGLQLVVIVYHLIFFTYNTGTNDNDPTLGSFSLVEEKNQVKMKCVAFS